MISFLELLQSLLAFSTCYRTVCLYLNHSLHICVVCADTFLPILHMNIHCVPHMNIHCVPMCGWFCFTTIVVWNSPYIWLQDDIIFFLLLWDATINCSILDLRKFFIPHFYLNNVDPSECLILRNNTCGTAPILSFYSKVFCLIICCSF